MNNVENQVQDGSNPPDYLFELIKLSIYAQEGNRKKMAQAVEGAVGKGAEGKEVLKALFRAEKMQQMTDEEKSQLVQRGVARLVNADFDKNTTQKLHFGVISPISQKFE